MGKAILADYEETKKLHTDANGWCVSHRQTRCPWLEEAERNIHGPQNEPVWASAYRAPPVPVPTH